MKRPRSLPWPSRRSPPPLAGLAPPAPAAHAALRLPPWLTPAAARWTCAGLIVLLLALALVYVGLARQAVFEQEQRQGELLAHVLADHSSRALEGVDLALAAVAGALEAGPPASAPDLGGHMLLTSMLRSLPQLRSVSLLDEAGRVLASTHVHNIGRRIPLRRLGLQPGQLPARLGPLLRGRDLAAVAQDAAEPGPALHFLPMVRRASLPGTGGQGWLVAALNPDAFANHFGLTAEPAGHSASLASFDGRLLTAGAAVVSDPGTDLRLLPVWREHLPGQEHGSLVGAGIDPGEHIVVWRVARGYPVVVLVERSVAQALGGWHRRVRQVGVLTALAVLCLIALGATASRSLAAQAQARRALVLTHERLRDREHMLSTMVENVQEMMFRTDADGRIDFVNARWEQVTGQPRDHALDRRLAEIVVPADREKVDALFAPGVPAGPGHAVQARLMHRDGSERRLEIVVAPLLGPLGKAPLAYTGFAADVSEREQALGQLRAQHDFVARMLEISPSPLLIKSRDGRIVAFNRAWSDFVGRPREALTGRREEELFGPEHALVHLRADREVLADGQRRDYEARLPGPDGRLRTVRIGKAAYTDDAGRRAGLIVSLVDVSDFSARERASQEARAQALQSAQALGAMVAAVVARSRAQPATLAAGLDELDALARLAQALDAAPPQALDLAVRTEARRAALAPAAAADGRALVWAGGAAPPAADADPRPGVAGAAGAGAVAAGPMGQGGAAAAAALPPVDLPQSLPPVAAEPALLDQALDHLLTLAWRRSPAGSRVCLHLGPGPEGAVLLSVDDAGSAPDEALLARPFAPLLLAEVPGLGGLEAPMLRQIVSGLGGRCWAESRPEGGLRWQLLLPAA